MKHIDLSDVQATGEYDKPVPGGYVCRITKATDVPDKEYLALEYDIAEGPLKDYFKGLHDAMGFWGGRFIRSYKVNALGFFKAFTESVEASNSGYRWNDNEATLTNKLIGLVLGEEEYTGNDGTVKTRLYVANMVPIERIRLGKYKVPSLKKLAQEKGIDAAARNLKPTEDETLPF